MAANKYSPRLTPIASAVHAILVGATVASGGAVTVRPAHAGNEPGTESTKRSYRIPAGPLGPALTSFAAASGVLLSADPALTQGKTTGGLIGDFTPEEGLAALLAGTGLEWAPGPGGTYTVRVRATPEAPMPAAEQPAPLDTILLDPITVTAQPLEQGFKADYQTTATRSALPIQETPASIGVATSDYIRDSFARTQNDAFEQVSGVSRNNTRLGRAEGFNIRGFIVNSFGGSFSGLKVNGLADDGVFAPDPALIERYEILKGPASIVGGASTVGGVVNRITKRPFAENFAIFEPQAGSFDFYRGVVDANGVLPQNENLRGRLILAYEDGGNFVDEVSVSQ